MMRPFFSLLLMTPLGLMSQQNAEPSSLRLGDDKHLIQYVTGPYQGPDLKNKPIAPFTLTTPDGRILKSEELKGKVLVMDFWATWCSPCRTLTGELDSLLKRYSDRKDLQMIGVNYNETLVNKGHDPVKYWKEHGYAWPMTLNNNEYGKAVNAGNPTVFLVDEEGILRGRWDAWTPGTSAEIANTVWALLEKPRVTEDEIQRYFDAKEYGKVLLMCDAFMKRYPGATAKLAPVKYNALVGTSDRMEAAVFIKGVIDTLEDYKVVAGKLLGGDPATLSLTKQQVFDSLMRQTGQARDYFVYMTVAQRCYKAGNRQGAIENMERAIDIVKNSKYANRGEMEWLNKELEKYKK